jgi:hypothetical protein
MWRYEQNTGRMFRPDGIMLAAGYSGAWDGAAVGGPNDHRNRSLDQGMHALGPIPVGTYDIGDAFDDVPGKGPVAAHLVPHPENAMFGRSGFMIHGDLSAPRSGQASEGCIILPRYAREAIADSDDRVLVVEVS